jgi:pyroglutamyl-peptidase
MTHHENIKVLVTGFGPFPGVHSNPSSDLLDQIENRKARSGSRVKLKTVLIPTRWDAVEKFTTETLAEFNPDIALHFGVHSRAKRLHVESRARNCTCTHADASGKIAACHCVVDGAPRTLKSTLETQKLVSRLNACGLPAQSSTNAGRYLCNALLFASLYQAGGTISQRQTGFIHIPPSPAQAMKNNAVLKCAELILSHCVARHIRQTLLNEASRD